MAPRMKGRHAGARSGIRHVATRLIGEVAVAAIFIGIVAFKVFSYVDPAVLRPSSVNSDISQAVGNSSSFVGNLPFLNNCQDNLAMHDVPGGFVCAQGPVTSAYDAIYRTYPIMGTGRESIYSSTDQGSLRAANDLLRDQFDLPRYAPIKLAGLPTWSEDPYRAEYGRFEFYSLRPSLNLLYAFRDTGDAAYANKLVALDLSFAAAEPRSRFAWADPHAVAFRSMALADTWWKLRQAHQLPEQASTTILAELEKTGQFLADANDYQANSNHSVNEAAALYELGVAFPTLPHAQQWLALGRQRIQWQLTGLIDADGQLIENSPYYDFYALQKYAQIYQYSVAQHSVISGEFPAKLAAMTNFATYILEPNSHVPLLGASIEATVNDHGIMRQLAATSPQLRYVLTHGAQGTTPPRSSVYFPASALTVMRSGWPSGAGFADSTYLTFNIGKYRTAHSHLDALGLTLYGDGGDLLPGAGLYTYAPGAYRDYFHGTESANTVVVDGKSQLPGDATAAPLMTTDGLTYQSGESSLYPGVTHQRLVMLLGKDQILVVDRLKSGSVHTYQQLFHLFPGARLATSGLTVTATGGTPARQVTMQELQPRGITESAVINQRGAKPAGLCSQQYGVLIPCYQVQYTAHGRNAEFMTLITVGKPQPADEVRVVGQRLAVNAGGRQFTVDIGQSTAKPMKAWATDSVAPTVRSTPVAASTVPANWSAAGDATLGFGRVPALGDATVARLTTQASGAPAYLVNNAIRLNLLRSDARLSLEISGFSRLSELHLLLSNDHWSKTASLNLLDAVGRTQSENWVPVFLAPGTQWGRTGGWRTSAPGFDWSAIDGVKMQIESRAAGGRPSSVSVAGLSLIPKQRAGTAVIIFDDGYQSILPAASYMRRNGMPGNVAVIGKYVDFPTKDHLNVSQLRQLQNGWGWNMVNHTQQHLDAVAAYYDKHDLAGYAQDILQQATWLARNGLNSAPNWFIYPHGDTNSALKSVVSRYYMFARVTAENPDAYPYGDPHAVTDLEISYPGDGGDGGDGGNGGSTSTTTPAEIQSAVNQAIAHHLTLILTFHRIKSIPGDPPGYPLALFKRVVDEIKRSRIQVMTLSQLDQRNGIPVTNRIHYQPAQPSQISAQVSMGGGTPRDGASARWAAWLAIGALALAVLIGIAFWARPHRNVPGARADAMASGGCVPTFSPPVDSSDAYDQQVLSLGPVLYLPLNNPSAPVPLDRSVGRPPVFYPPGGGQPVTTRLPNGDLATVFDGNGQYVEVPSAKQLSVSETGCLTVEAWIRPDVVQFPHEQGTGYVYVLGKGTDGKQEYALRMYSQRNTEVPPRPNRVSAYVFNLAGGKGSGAYFQDDVRPGEWMMVAFVIDSRPSEQWPSGSLTIYKDGVRRDGPVSLKQFNVVPGASDAPFRIGTRDLESYFEGAIGKVAVYDSLLTDQEIRAAYEAMIP